MLFDCRDVPRPLTTVQATDAGALSSRVGTRWSVDDNAAAEFSQRFFARLAAGDSNGPALNAATREQLAAGKKAGRAHPFYWASHTLTERGR